MSQKKRKRYTLDEKYELGLRLEKGENVTSVAKTTNIPRAVISDIKRSWSAIKANHESNVIKPGAKSLKKGKYPELEKEVTAAITSLNERGGGSLSNLQIQDIVKMKSKEMNIVDFKGSYGFVQKLKKRENIRTVVHGDAGSVSQAVEELWKLQVPKLIQGYEPKDVWNADELGLFYQLPPTKTLAVKGKQCRTGKLSKSRVTVLLCCNMDGSEKRTPVVIGKAAKPRVLRTIMKNDALSKLVVYRSNKTAWMTSEIFKSYLTEWDSELSSEGRKIVLFVDNCPAHPEMSLSNIKLLYFPKCASGVLQPLDQGVVKCLKGGYRKRIMRKVVTEMMVNPTLSADDVKITMLDAAIFIHYSLKDVAPITIANCFRKSHFGTADLGEETADDDDIGILWCEMMTTPDGVTLEDYITADDSLVCRDSNVDTAASPDVEVDQAVDEDGEFDSEVYRNLPNFIEVQSAVSILKKLIPFNDEEYLNSIESIEKCVYKPGLIPQNQSVVTNYFQNYCNVIL